MTTICNGYTTHVFSVLVNPTYHARHHLVEGLRVKASLNAHLGNGRCCHLPLAITLINSGLPSNGNALVVRLPADSQMCGEWIGNGAWGWAKVFTTWRVKTANTNEISRNYLAKRCAA